MQKYKKSFKKYLRPLLSFMLVLSMLTGNFVGVRLEFLIPEVQAYVPGTIPDIDVLPFAGSISPNDVPYETKFSALLPLIPNDVAPQLNLFRSHMFSGATIMLPLTRRYTTFTDLPNAIPLSGNSDIYGLNTTSIHTAINTHILDTFPAGAFRVPKTGLGRYTPYLIEETYLSDTIIMSDSSHTMESYHYIFPGLSTSYETGSAWYYTNTLEVLTSINSLNGVNLQPRSSLDSYPNYYPNYFDLYTAEFSPAADRYFIKNKSNNSDICNYKLSLNKNSISRIQSMPSGRIIYPVYGVIKIPNILQDIESAVINGNQSILDNDIKPFLDKMRDAWESDPYINQPYYWGNMSFDDNYKDNPAASGHLQECFQPSQYFNYYLQYDILLRYARSAITEFNTVYNNEVRRIQSIADRLVVDQYIDNNPNLFDEQKIRLHQLAFEQMSTLGQSIVPSTTVINTSQSTFGVASNIGVTVTNTDTSSQFTVVKPDGSSVKINAPNTVYFPVTKNGTYTFYVTSPTGQTVTVPVVVSSYRNTPSVTIAPVTTAMTSGKADTVISATSADEILQVSVTNPAGQTSVIGKTSGTYSATANGHYRVHVKTVYQDYWDIAAFDVSTVFPTATGSNPYTITQYQTNITSAYPISPSANGTRVSGNTIGFYISPANYTYKVHCDTTNQDLSRNSSGYYLLNVDKNQTYDFTIIDPTGETVNRSINVTSIQSTPTLTLNYKLNAKGTEATIYATSAGTTSTSKLRITDSLSNPTGGTIIGTNSANYNVSENGTYYFSVVNEDGTYYSNSVTVSGIVSEVVVDANLKHVLTDGTLITNADTSTLSYSTSSEVKQTYIQGAITSAGSKSEYTVSGPNAEEIALSDLKTFNYPITGNGTYTFTIKHSLGDVRTVSYGVTNYISKPVEATLTHIKEDGSALSSSDLLDFASESERPTTYIKGQITSSGAASQYKVTGPNTTDITVEMDKTFKYPITDNGVYTFTVQSTTGSSQTYQMNITNYNNTLPTLTLQHVLADGSVLNNSTYLTYTGASEIVTSYIKATVSSGGSASDYTLVGPDGDNLTLEADKTCMFPITGNANYSFTLTSSSGKTVTKAYNVSNYKNVKPVLQLELVDEEGNTISSTSPINYAGMSEKVTTYVKGTIQSGGVKADYTVTAPDSTTLTLTDEKTFKYPINDNGTYTFLVEANTDTSLQKSYIVNNYKLAPPTVSLVQVDEAGNELDSEVPLEYAGISDKPTTYIKGKITSTGLASDYQVLSPTYDVLTVEADKTFKFPVTENGIYSFTITSTTESTIVKSYCIKNYKQITPTFTLSQINADGDVLSDTDFQEFTSLEDVPTTYIKGQITSGGVASDYVVTGSLNEILPVNDDLSFTYPITGNGTYSFTVKTDSTHTISDSYTVNNYRCTPNISIIPSTTAITDSGVNLSVSVLCQDDIDSLTITDPSGNTTPLGKTSGLLTATENGVYTVTVTTKHGTHNVYTKTYTVSNIIDEIMIDVVVDNNYEDYNVLLNTEDELNEYEVEQFTNCRVESVDVKFTLYPTEDVDENELTYTITSEHLASPVNVINGTYTENIRTNGTFEYNILLPTGESITKTVTVSTIQPIPDLELSYDINDDNTATVYITASSADGLSKVTNNEGRLVGRDEELSVTIKSNGNYMFTAYGRNGAYVSRIIKINTVPDTPEITINHTELGDPINSVRMYPSVKTAYGVYSITLPNGETIIYNGQPGDFDYTDAEFVAKCNGRYKYVIQDNNGGVYTQTHTVDCISSVPTIKAELSNSDWTNETPLTLSISVRDNSGTGLKTVRVSRTYEGESVNKIIRTYSPGTAPASYEEDISVDRNATYTIEVWDNTMNINDDPYTLKERIINIDTVKPTLSVTTDDDPTQWARSIVYKFSADDNCAIKNVICSNGLSIPICEGEIEFSQNGTYTLTAYDWAGNASDVVTIEVNKIDNGEPTINIIQDSYGNIENPVVFKLTFFNAISPLKEIIYPDGTVVDISDKNKNLYKTTYTAPDNGLYEFTIKNMTDYEATASVQLTTVDRNAPQLSITPSTTEWTAGNVILSIQATDAESTPKIILPDGTPINSGEATYTVPQNGAYTIQAVDRAGNVTKETITVSNIDKSQPLPVTVTRTGTDIELNASLPISGLKAITVDIEDITKGTPAITESLPFSGPIYPTEESNSQTFQFNLSRFNLDIADKYKFTFYAYNSLDVQGQPSTMTYMYIPSAESLDSSISDDLGSNPSSNQVIQSVQDIQDILNSMDKDDPMYDSILELYKKYLGEYNKSIYKEIFTSGNVMTPEILQQYIDKISQYTDPSNPYSSQISQDLANLLNLQSILKNYQNALSYDENKSIEQALRDLEYLKSLKSQFTDLDFTEIERKYKDLISNSIGSLISDKLNQYTEILNNGGSSEDISKVTNEITDIINRYGQYLDSSSAERIQNVINDYLEQTKNNIFDKYETVKNDGSNTTDVKDIIEQIKKYTEIAGDDYSHDIVGKVFDSFKDRVINTDTTNFTLEDYQELLKQILAHKELERYMTDEQKSYLEELRKEIQKKVQEKLVEKITEGVTKDNLDSTVKDILDRFTNPSDSDATKEENNQTLLDAIQGVLDKISNTDGTTSGDYQTVKDALDKLTQNTDFMNSLTDAQKEILDKLIKDVTDKIKEQAKQNINLGNADTTLPDLVDSITADGNANAEDKQVLFDIVSKLLEELTSKGDATVSDYQKLKDLLQKLIDNLKLTSQLTDAEKNALQSTIDQLKAKIEQLEDGDKKDDKPKPTPSTSPDTGGSSGSSGGGGGGSSSDTSDTTPTQNPNNTSSSVSQLKSYKVQVTVEQEYLNAVRSYTVAHGKSFTTTINLPSGYVISQVLVNNKSYEFNKNVISVPAITGFTDIYVQVSPIGKDEGSYFKVTPTYLGYGTLNYSVPFNVNKGTEVSIEAKPEEGYKVGGIYVNNVYMSTNQTKYTFKNIAQDINLEVLFVRKDGIPTGSIRYEHTYKFKIGTNTVNDGTSTVKIAATTQKANNVPYVSLNALVSLLNIPNENLRWNASEKTLILYTDNDMYKLKVGDKYLLKNGIEQTLSAPAGLLDSRLMIPISAIPVLFKECSPKITWDTNTGEITLKITDLGYPTRTISDYNYYF